MSAMFKKFYQFLYIIHVISTITSDFVKKESFVKGLNYIYGPYRFIRKKQLCSKVLINASQKSLDKILKRLMSYLH